MFDSELVLLQSGSAQHVWDGTADSLRARMRAEDWSATRLCLSNMSPGWTSPVVQILQDPRSKISSLRVDFDNSMLGMDGDVGELVAYFRAAAGKTGKFAVTSVRFDASSCSLDRACPALLGLVDAVLRSPRVDTLGVVCTPGMIRQLAQSISQGSWVRTLIVSGGSYEAEPFREFAAALAGSKSIHALQLNLRSFDDVYAQTLAQALPKSQVSALKIINARRLGPMGSVHLANAVKHPKSRIATLKIHGGSIGGKGARVFAEALERGCALERVDLCHNELGSGGIRRLIRAMRSPDYRVGVELDALLGNEVEEDSPLWRFFNQTKLDMKAGRLVLALVSAREVPRLGSRCALRRLPTEMFRLVGEMCA